MRYRLQVVAFTQDNTQHRSRDTWQLRAPVVHIQMLLMAMRMHMLIMYFKDTVVSADAAYLWRFRQVGVVPSKLLL